ncbi:MAG: hypothetical protein CMC97_02170 [Flavobacteriales bacterium]|nr:hypothetical protein [Flavobacteriales bacterium]
MKGRLGRVLKYVLMLGIGGVLFGLAMGAVDDPDALWADMRSANGWCIAASFLMGYLAIVSRGVRWLILLEPLGHQPKMSNSIHAVAFSYFSNTFVPRSGELARCGALNQTDGIPVDELFGTVISERVVDFALLFILTAVALTLNLDSFIAFSESFSLPGGGGMLPWLGGAAAVAFVMAAVVWVRREALSRIPFFAKVFGFIAGIGRGLASVRHMKRKWAFLGHTFFIWSMYFMMAYIIFLGIGALEDLTAAQALFVMMAGGFGMVLPSPGGIGSYQLAVQFAFIALGYGSVLGLATANVVWATQTGMIIVTGGMGYLFLMAAGLRKGKPTTDPTA